MLTERELQLKSVQYRQALLRLIKAANAGHDLGELVRTFEAVPFRPGKPSVVLAKTRKGKGVSFMANVAKWHHGVPTEEEFSRAMAELEAAQAALG